MKATSMTMDTPDGPFTIIRADSSDSASHPGAVLAAGWTADTADLIGQIHQTLMPEDIVPVSTMGAVSAAVDEYYAGNMGPIRAVEVLQKSGPFRQHAWEVLRDVTPGHPVSYTEYATLSGSPKAIRAAAGACAFNAAALFVPCHRVLRNDGSLGGFRWGLAIKESLLAREATGS